jgi:D-methionine transport system ATP-binding protein
MTSVQVETGGTAQGRTPHILFDRVRKTYHADDGKNVVEALRDVSFSIERGEVFGIIGRSGAGKSTLLRTINALETPCSGTVTVDDIDVGSLNERELVALRRRVGMIFQHFNLLSTKTVFENVALPLKVAGVEPQRIRARVEELLELVGLTDKANVYPAKLSGGQKQRVGIARALVHKPEVLLCDEATSALDPETTEAILALLREINLRLGVTVVLITHDMSVIRAICDRVLIIDDGVCQEMGEVWHVFGDPQSAATRALLHPLQHGLPGDLAAVLQKSAAEGKPPSVAHAEGSDSAQDEAVAIIQVQFSGVAHPQGVTLAALAALGPQVALLHGGLDRIRGHAQGRLLLSLPRADLPAESAPYPALCKALGASRIEILGYTHAAF